MKNKLNNSESIIFAEKPAKRRYTIIWTLSLLFIFPFFAVWMAYIKDFSVEFLIIAIALLVLFFSAIVLISMILVKKTLYAITNKRVIIKSGIVKPIQLILEFNDIVFFRKAFNLVDLFLKKKTGSIEIYIVETKKSGKKLLRKSPIFSFFGIKRINEVEKIFKEKDIKQLLDPRQKKIKKQMLNDEWRELKYIKSIAKFNKRIERQRILRAIKQRNK